MDKELIVHTTPMVDVNGSTNIPTVVFYNSGAYTVGAEAIELAKSRGGLLNEDFKVDLGMYDPSRTTRKRFATNSGQAKSAGELTADFISAVLSSARSWLAFNGLDVAPSILLAEPLKDPKNPDWIKNYRSSLERILLGKGFTKKQIDFLPEPFAVFQFYRYGYRHPGLADKISYRALVLDFGGGTFDTCVVETKRDGDISQSGKNSNPLGASSNPIGGFEINRLVAESLAHQQHRGQESLVRKAVEIYGKWRRSGEELSSYSSEFQHFISKFHKLVHDVEESKLQVSKNIMDWRLDKTASFSVPVKVPRDFFANGGGNTNLHLKASEVQGIFCNKVWPRLKDAIKQTLDHAQSEMYGDRVNAVLLSGGSCGFGWLKQLIMRDFNKELGGVNILSLPDYQEIVAKGLAIECARRFYTHQGDFGSTTYNRLCLTLDSGQGQALAKFSPRFTSGKINLPEGVLVPSSTSLAGLIDTPLRWKFRLDHPPKQRLDYFFLRSSFDPDDVANLQNVEQTTIFTPAKTVFDSQLQVELTVDEKGTAQPKFIYKTGQNGEDLFSVTGRPFFLDMTNVGSEEISAAYIGLDFGTSNSAIAYLSRENMDLLKSRSTDSDWLSLSGLINALPYPLARTLNRFVGGSSSLQSHDSFMRALDFFESALSLMAYAAYGELCTLALGKTRYLKGFTQRSVGPLWSLLRDILRQIGKRATAMAPALRLLDAKNSAEMDRIVKWFNQRKHQKAPEDEINLTTAILMIGNISNDIFKTAFFGYFENVQRNRFKKGYTGRFRIAHGSSQPFPLYMDYSGSEDFAELEPFILNTTPSRAEAIRLTPLSFWDNCSIHSSTEEPHYFLFDRMVGDSIEYKASGFDCSITLEEGTHYQTLREEIINYKQEDPFVERTFIESITPMADGSEG